MSIVLHHAQFGPDGDVWIPFAGWSPPSAEVRDALPMPPGVRDPSGVKYFNLSRHIRDQIEGAP
jgi:hypothetical protein